MNKQQKKKNEILSKPSVNLNNRRILASILSIVSLILIIFGISYWSNPSFRETFLNRNNQSASLTINTETSDLELENILSQVEPEALLFKEITLEQLDIYPPAWVERHFSQGEITNTLFSGPSGDADNDGLINKLEYFYGSDPRNTDSLCNGNIDGETCVGRNDKENVDNGISPLTGNRLEPEKKFKVNSQDTAILKSLESSFDQAAKEGVDFPTLYQLSRSIDNTEELNRIQINIVDETRDTLVAYAQSQGEFLKEITNRSELDGFNEIFSVNSSDSLQALANNYKIILDKLLQTPVPQSYVQSHKGYTYIYIKMIEIIELRIKALEAGTLDNEETLNELRNTAVEFVWGYRYLEELS